MQFLHNPEEFNRRKITFAVDLMLTPYGAELEYHQRNLVNHGRRRKGISLSGSITGPPCLWETQIVTKSSRFGVERKAKDLDI
jgi:hypothetical protein